uniref:Si:dkey-29d8.3 n=1 Tax=Kryptolebias marmoratus TaxID=37003 RepID=A0A3Q3H0Q1_KRYMA
AVLVVNALAGAGRPFQFPTANVSARYETDITPAGWTFSIWGVIYTWLTLMVIYIISYVFRSWAQSLLPYSFYFSWLCNMLLNITWLVLWDRLMLAGLVVLILIAFTNYSALFFCCYATDYHGQWLQTYHGKDLACLRILVQNGLAVYSTWTSIASLINFAVVLHLWGVDKSTAATACLCILFAEVVG